MKAKAKPRITHSPYASATSAALSVGQEVTLYGGNSTVYKIIGGFGAYWVQEADGSLHQCEGYRLQHGRHRTFAPAGEVIHKDAPCQYSHLRVVVDNGTAA